MRRAAPTVTEGERAYQAIGEVLFDRPPAANTFNPYADHSPEHDLPDAVEIRRANLKNYLDSVPKNPRLFLLAEAPGPWGCRFSGVPITAESQLLDPEFPINGRQSSRREEPHREYSASIFWRLLSDVFPSFFVWNACPLHPYKPGKPFSIRAPRVGELREFLPLAAQLVEIYGPARVLAVGRKAERSLTEAGLEATYVRHPSQGGANAFRAGVLAALEEMPS